MFITTILTVISVLLFGTGLSLYVLNMSVYAIAMLLLGTAALAADLAVFFTKAKKIKEKFYNTDENIVLLNENINKIHADIINIFKENEKRINAVGEKVDNNTNSMTVAFSEYMKETKILNENVDAAVKNIYTYISSINAYMKEWENNSSILMDNTVKGLGKSINEMLNKTVAENKSSNKALMNSFSEKLNNSLALLEEANLQQNEKTNGYIEEAIFAYNQAKIENADSIAKINSILKNNSERLTSSLNAYSEKTAETYRNFQQISDSILTYVSDINDYMKECENKNQLLLNTAVKELSRNIKNLLEETEQKNSSSNAEFMDLLGTRLGDNLEQLEKINIQQNETTNNHIREAVSAYNRAMEENADSIQKINEIMSNTSENIGISLDRYSKKTEALCNDFRETSASIFKYVSDINEYMEECESKNQKLLEEAIKELSENIGFLFEDISEKSMKKSEETFNKINGYFSDLNENIAEISLTLNQGTEAMAEDVSNYIDNTDKYSKELRGIVSSIKDSQENFIKNISSLQTEYKQLNEKDIKLLEGIINGNKSNIGGTSYQGKKQKY